jgi:hypothetical protein
MKISPTNAMQQDTSLFDQTLLHKDASSLSSGAAILPEQTEEISASSGDSSSSRNTATKNVTATGNNNIDGLLTKKKWASNTVSFSFPNNFADYGSKYDQNYSSGFAELDSDPPRTIGQKAAARKWLIEYASVSLLKPVEIIGADDRNATIRLAMSNLPENATGGFPGQTRAGDVWFNPRYNGR